MNHLPKLTLPGPPSKSPDQHIRFAPVLTEVAPLAPMDVFTRMKSEPIGLTASEVAGRLAEAGPNVVAAAKHRGWFWRLLAAARNPLVILLTVLAAI